MEEEMFSGNEEREVPEMRPRFSPPLPHAVSAQTRLIPRQPALDPFRLRQWGPCLRLFPFPQPSFRLRSCPQQPEKSTRK